MRPFFRNLIIGLLRFQINTIALFSPLKAGRMALDIFRTPRKGRLREQYKTFLAGAKWETLQAEGLDIQTYRWEGSGPTILLAHGWESNSARWRTFINVFRKKGYKIVALDAPGHGATSSDRFDAHSYGLAMKAVAERFEPAFIIGHSAGGMSVLYYLATFKPSFVRGGVVIAAPSSLRKILKNFYGIMQLSPRAILGMDLAILEKFAQPTEAFDLFDFARNTEVSGLLLFDAGDQIADFSEGQQLAEVWKNSRFVGFEGLGHSVNGKAVVEEVVGFVAEFG
jgi:pimeloyl-ACP methyl ester carboxylesterase